MAQKKKQHYVPQVYLKAFCDPRPPAGWDETRPFTPSVWLIDPTLSGEPRRKAPSSILWQSHLYTLREDDPTRPSIEETLSQLESEYAHTLAKVGDLKPLAVRDLITLTVFVGLLQWRIPVQMDFWQEQIAEIERIYRQVDQAANGSERFSDEFWAGADEAVKRLIVENAGGYSRLITPCAFLVVNDSPMPLVASDNPVVHRFVHVDEFQSWGFPEDRLLPGALPSERVFFSYTPVSPKVGMVSSPLLAAPADSLYWPTADLRLILSLNELTRRHADQSLISAYANPYGPLKDAVIQLSTMRKAERRSGLRIYTERDRHWLPCESVVHSRGDHPLNSRLTFTTTDQEELRAAASAECLVEVTNYHNGEVRGGMRDARFLSVGLYKDAPSVVENGPE